MSFLYSCIIPNESNIIIYFVLWMFINELCEHKNNSYKFYECIMITYIVVRNFT